MKHIRLIAPQPGQCILTLVRFGKQNIALKVALKTISKCKNLMVALSSENLNTIQLTHLL